MNRCFQTVFLTQSTNAITLANHNTKHVEHNIRQSYCKAELCSQCETREKSSKLRFVCVAGGSVVEERAIGLGFALNRLQSVARFLSESYSVLKHII